MRAGAIPLALAVQLCLLATAARGATDLEPPVRLKAGGQLIDTDVGHAAPFLADIDGDGDRDLLVGQFGGGKLKIFPNVGTEQKPAYGECTWLKAGGELCKVPTG